MDSKGSLPAELLVLIFTNLHFKPLQVLRGVCRRWKYLIDEDTQRFKLQYLLLRASEIKSYLGREGHESCPEHVWMKWGFLATEQKLFFDPYIPFTWLIYNGYLTALIELLKRYKDLCIAVNDNEAIQLAAENGHIQIVEYLLFKGVYPSSRDNLAIRLAAKNGHASVVARLLQDPRVDPSVGDNSAIKTSAENGHFDVVDLLLKDPRVNPFADNKYAFRLAEKNGHEKVLFRLLNDH